MGNINLGDKVFENVGTAGNPIYNITAQSPTVDNSGRISASTGWRELGKSYLRWSFYHGLNTENYIAQVWVAKDKDGKSSRELQSYQIWWTGTSQSIDMGGAQLYNPTKNRISLATGRGAWPAMMWQYWEYIKIMVVSMPNIWTSGWRDMDDYNVPLGKFRTLSFRHNITSSNLIAQAWVAKDSAGKGAVQLQSYELEDPSLKWIQRGGSISRLDEGHVDVDLYQSGFDLSNDIQGWNRRDPIISFDTALGGNSYKELWWIPWGPYVFNTSTREYQYEEHSFKYLKVCVL